jgi:hypothetical protein
MNVNDLLDWLEEARTDINKLFDDLSEWDEEDYKYAITEHLNIEGILRDFGEVDKAYHERSEV